MRRTILILGTAIGLVLTTQADAQFASDSIYEEVLYTRIGNDESYIYPLDTKTIASETIMIPVTDNGSGTTEFSANVYYPNPDKPE